MPWFWKKKKKNKKVPWFLKKKKKKDAGCVHLWVKFSNQNVILTNFKIFPYRVFFLCFCRNVYRSALVPQNLPCPEKFLVAYLHSDIVLFAKCSILNVWQCSAYISLNNCSVICTVTLCFVLHQIHSKFSHIKNCLFRYM